MVKAQFNRHDDEIIEIVISGHADSGTGEYDMVCAEVSAIGVGTLNAVDQMCNESCTMEMDNGYIRIRVNRNSELLQTILKMMEIQLLTVEHTNKDYISVRKVEV